ncbi:MAG: response regulator [Terrimicrobiaceae bacterium]
MLTDYSLLTSPDKNGLELIKDIRAVHPQLPVLIISMHEESLYAERVLRAGARGYITREELISYAARWSASRGRRSPAGGRAGT